MKDEKDDTLESKDTNTQTTKSISEKSWEDDDDWMDDPSGINPGC